MYVCREGSNPLDAVMFVYSISCGLVAVLLEQDIGKSGCRTLGYPK